MSDSRLDITLAELTDAAELIYKVAPPTPQYAWPKLRQRAGCTVWVKHENYTPTGAFKVRGGVVYMDRLRRARADIPGVITATRGNHGQSIAFSAARAGIPATIYVPYGNSPDQNASMAAFGARVKEFGRDFDEAKHEARRAGDAEGLHFLPSFHRDLVMGVASYAFELLSSVKNLDAAYVGVGMGTGICGLITVRDLLGLKTRIIGVSAANAPANALSFEAGRVVTTASARTFADGIATREPPAEAVDIYRAGADHFVQVSEEEIAEAMRIYYDDAHQISEGAGAAPLAALMKERGTLTNRNVAVILSGGNIERERMTQVLAGRCPR
jgi:threonine dehydratase